MSYRTLVCVACAAGHQGVRGVLEQLAELWGQETKTNTKALLEEHKTQTWLCQWHRSNQLQMLGMNPLVILATSRPRLGGIGRWCCGCWHHDVSREAWADPGATPLLGTLTWQHALLLLLLHAVGFLPDTRYENDLWLKKGKFQSQHQGILKIFSGALLFLTGLLPAVPNKLATGFSWIITFFPP